MNVPAKTFYFQLSGLNPGEAADLPQVLADRIRRRAGEKMAQHVIAELLAHPVDVDDDGVCQAQVTLAFPRFEATSDPAVLADWGPACGHARGACLAVLDQIGAWLRDTPGAAVIAVEVAVTAIP